MADTRLTRGYMEEPKPRVLPCGHTVSETLLLRIGQSWGENRIECPACHRTYAIPQDGAVGFPVNNNIEDGFSNRKSVVRQENNNYKPSIVSNVSSEKNTNMIYEILKPDGRAIDSERSYSNSKQVHAVDEFVGFKLLSPEFRDDESSSRDKHELPNDTKFPHPGFKLISPPKRQGGNISPIKPFVESPQQSEFGYQAANLPTKVDAHYGIVAKGDASTTNGRFADIAGRSSADIIHPTFKLLTEKHKSFRSTSPEVVTPFIYTENFHSQSPKQVEGSFTVIFEINKINETNVNYYSRDHEINNLSWRLGVRREGQRSSLGIYLYLNRGSDDVMSCTADRQIKLVNSREDNSSIVNVVKGDVYVPGGDGKGWRGFIQWKELIHPRNGFLNDGYLTIQANVKIIGLKKRLT